jgi:hypothetical protein
VGMNATGPSVRDPLGNTDRAIAYVEWRLACLAVWAAYRDSTDAANADAALAQAAYEAALDREAAAASAYARLVRTTCRSTSRPADSRCADNAPPAR